MFEYCEACSIKGVNRMLKKIATLLLITVVVGFAACKRDDPSVLEQIAGLGPFREFSEYDTYEEEKGRNGTKWVAKRKIVIVVRKGLTKDELNTIAWTYHKAFPTAQVDFFDDESGLNNYVNGDSFNPQEGRKPEATYDADFRSKHRVATLSEGVNGEWNVSTEYYTGR